VKNIFSSLCAFARFNLKMVTIKKSITL